MQKFDALAEKIAVLCGEKNIDQPMPSAIASELHYHDFDPQTKLFSNKQSDGFVLELLPPSYVGHEHLEILSAWLLNHLPFGCDIQWLFHASPEIEPYFSRFLDARCETQNPLHRQFAEKRVSFLRKGAWQSLNPYSNLLLRNFKLYMSVSKPRNNKTKDIDLLHIQSRLLANLRSANIYATPLDANGLLNLIDQYLFPKLAIDCIKPDWNPLQPLSEQVGSPSVRLDVKPEQIDISRARPRDKTDAIDSKWTVKTLSVSRLPSEFSQNQASELIGQLFSENFQLPCPVWMSLAIRMSEPSSARLRANVKYLSLDRKMNQGLGKFFSKLPKLHAETKAFRDLLEEGDRRCDMAYQVSMVSPSDHIDDAEAALSGLYRASGFSMEKSSCIQLPLWLSALPFRASEGAFDDTKALGRTKIMSVRQALQIAPLQGEWKGTKSAGLLLAGRKGQLSTWWPFDTKGNKNICVAGTSGSGKSVLIQELATAVLGGNGRVWILDSGYSFAKLCNHLGGTFLAFNTAQKLSLNPFSSIEKLDDSQHELLQSLICAMARPKQEVSREEETYIEQAISDVWRAKGQKAGMVDIVSWMLSKENAICQNLAQLLFSYGPEGKFRDYFTGESLWDTKNPLFLLELSDLEKTPELQQMVLLIAIYRIYSAMCFGDRDQPKMCIIDEAWDLLGKGAASFIAKGYRTARKYNASFVAISQSVNDFKMNDAAIAAWSNSAYKICLKQPSDIIAQMRQQGDMKDSDFLENLYNSLESNDYYSEFIIAADGSYSAHRLLLDEYSKLLYSSDASDVYAIEQQMAQGKSAFEAIDFIINQGDKS